MPSDLITLVIVDDYKLTRVGLNAILTEDIGIQVVGEAEDGETSITLVEKTQPHVVLMDLGLPGMSGIEATQIIKSRFEGMKVIILTSHEREEEVVAAMGAGANAYCLKDISSERLIEVIKSVHDGAAWLDPAIASIALKVFTQSPSQPVSTAESAAAAEWDEQVNLTEREMEVLKLLVDGKSNTEIADELIISFHTAKAHVCSILAKLCVNDRVQAAVKAVKAGII